MQRDLDQVQQVLAVCGAELHRAREALATEDLAPETRHALIHLGQQVRTIGLRMCPTAPSSAWWRHRRP